MYYIEFLDNYYNLVSRGKMDTLPRRGDFIFENQIYKVYDIIFMSDCNYLQELYDAIYVVIKVKPIRSPVSKWEGRGYKLIIMLWVFVISFLSYGLYVKLISPKPPMLIPGIGRVINPPLYQDTPKEIEETPKPKGMII